jgi:alpha-beta hydrolase superfamily lysophospholipase
MRDDHFTFKAGDAAPIFVYRWRPDVGVGKAVVHIAHGLAEHAGRYERLAEALTTAGYLVCAHDYRGHGRTARGLDETGHFGDGDGWRVLVGDLVAICRAEKAEYPKLPLILFAHSLGTSLAQQVIYEHPDLFHAVAMSGPNGRVSALVGIGRLLAKLERRRLGKRGRSKLLNSLSFGNFNKAFQPNRTSFDWLSRDEREVDRYLADPMCGFIASTESWVEILTAIPALARTENRARIRKDLLIYLFSGGDDQVNENGRGCEALARAYRAAGLKNVSYKIYPHARHETLNETNREQVTADLIEWMDCVRVLVPSQ